MLILYVYDTNEILVETIKTRIDTYMLRAYDVLYDTLENGGHAPKLKMMDNEAPAALTQLLQKRMTVVKLAPPHTQRINTAERDIHT